jgi:2'-5' RNA ligase
MKRLFVGIPYTPGSQFRTHMQELRATCQGDRINWVKPDQMHCTIQFLGDCEEEHLAGISAAVTDAVKGIAPFPVVSGGLGYFGSPAQPKVLWAGWEDNGMAESIFKRLSPLLLKSGIAEPETQFHPHITIGRVRYTQNSFQLLNSLGRYRDVIFDRFNAREVWLVESKLTPEGPVYEVITRVPLV